MNILKNIIDNVLGVIAHKEDVSERRIFQRIKEFKERYGDLLSDEVKEKENNTLYNNKDNSNEIEPSIEGFNNT